MISNMSLSTSINEIAEGLKAYNNEIAKWIENKPEIPVISALCTAMSSDHYYNIYKNLHGYYAGNDFSAYVNNDQWIDLYKCGSSIYKKIIDQVFDHFQYNKPFLELFTVLFGQFQHVLNRNDSAHFKKRIIGFFSLNQKKADEIIEFIKNANLKNLEQYCENLPEKDWRNYKLPISMEIFFAVRVIHPCELIYAENPFKLFRESQNGNCDAICKLIKVDKVIIKDHKIARAVAAYSVDIDSQEYKKYHKR